MPHEDVTPSHTISWAMRAVVAGVVSGRGLGNVCADSHTHQGHTGYDCEGDTRGDVNWLLERSHREIKLSVSVRKRSPLVGCVPRQVHIGKALGGIVTTVDPKYQRLSTCWQEHGTHQNSWTLFELSVGPQEPSRIRQPQTRIEILDWGLYEKAKRGENRR